MQSSTTTGTRIAPCVVSEKTFCFDGSKILGMLDTKTCKFEDQNGDRIATGKSVHETDFQGQTISVFHLSELLGLAKRSATDDTVVIVVSTDSGPQGFIVDDALRSREPKRLVPLPASCYSSDNPFFNGVAIWDDGESFETEEQFGLRLCADGLTGGSLKQGSGFTEHKIDVKSFSHVGTDRSKRQLMLFDVPHQDWKNQVVSIALSVTQVLEIVTPQPLIQVPLGPNGTLGLLQWRDCFVPVVDLTENLSLGSIPESARRRIVVAREADSLFAFYTSTSIRTLAKSLAEAKAIDMGQVSKSRWAKGTFSVSDDVIVLPNLAV